MSHPTNLKLTLVDSKRTAEQLLHDAEDIDYYLETCRDDPINLRARRRQVYAPNSISPKETVYYQSVLQHSIQNLPKRLQMDLQEVKVISLMPSADSGMPHTRPYSMICFPQIEQIESLSTLTHELWHVHQRKYVDTWTKIFERLGWKLWSNRLPSFLEKNRRINPDTIDQPLWIYDDTWIPVPIFRDIALPNMTEVDIWFYHAKEEYHLKQIPNKMNAYFSGIPKSSFEHPRELTAYLLADHQKYQQTPALKDLLDSVGNLAISS